MTHDLNKYFHVKMIRYSVIFVFMLYFSSTYGLKCYVCSSTADDYDDSCTSSPTEDMTRDCNKKYCNIIRVEDKDPKDMISSMSRGCNDAYLNGITEDQTHRIYQMSCKQDYCNSGNGKTGSNGNRNYIGDKSTIYCPGSESSAVSPLLSFTLIFTLLLIKLLI